MSPLRPPTRVRESPAFVPIFLANLIPLVGVLWFGWEPATLVFIYGLEVALSLVLAAGKALFAQQPPPTDGGGVVSVSEARLADKRGAVQPNRRLPPIPLRNIPFALGVSFLVGAYAIMLVAVVAVTVDDAAQLTQTGVLLSVLALCGGQLLETRREFVGQRVYEQVSPHAVIEPPARQLFVLVFVLAFLGLPVGSTATLVAVVLAKLLVEWSTVRAMRADAETNRFVDRFAAWLSGTTDQTGALERIHVPPVRPRERVRSDRTAVALEGVLLALWGTGVYLPFVGVGWFFILLVVVAWADSILLFWLGVAAFGLLLVAIAAIQFVRYYLVTGTLEYQRREDTLVAYDWLVDEPQWAVPVDELRDAAVVTDRFADRVLGTRTIRVTTGWGERERERRLGPVSEPTRLLEAADLSLSTTDLEPINRPLAAGAVILAGAIVLLVPAVIAAPWVSIGAHLELVWLVPFALVVPWKLWQRACPPPE